MNSIRLLSFKRQNSARSIKWASSFDQYLLLFSSNHMLVRVLSCLATGSSHQRRGTSFVLPEHALTQDLVPNKRFQACTGQCSVADLKGR
jgi:hypothetical protein